MKHKRIFVLLILAAIFCTAKYSYAQLQIVSPNGGEVLKPGSTFSVQWAGVSSSEKIDLDYSTDDGAIWMAIAKQITGLQYSWVVPNTISTKCLLRASVPGKIFSDSILADGVSHAGDKNTFIWNGQSTALAFGFTNEIIDAKDLHTIYKYSLNNSSNVNFSPDGGLALFPKNGGTVDVVDLKKLQIVKEFNGDFTFGLHWLKNDDRHFLSVASQIVRWDTTGDVPIDTMKTKTWSYSMYIDECVVKNRLAVAYGSGIPYGILFDLSTGDSLFTMNLGENIDGLSISPDGSMVAVFGYYSTIGIWNITTGGLITKMTMPDISRYDGYWNPSFAWSPDNRHIAVPSQHDSIIIWDVTNGSLTQILHPGRAGKASDIAYHPGDGKWVASSTTNAEVLIFDPSTGTLLQTVNFAGKPTNGPGSGLGFMIWSPDGTRLAIRDGYGRVGILFVDPKPGKQAISGSTWSISTISPKHFSLRIGSDSAFAGEKIDLPVIISDPATAIAQGATSVNATFEYNATMLEPLAPTTSGVITKNLRNASVTFPVTSSTDTIIGMVHFRAGLGNALSTSLHIDSSSSNTPNAILDNTDGTFTLRGICTQGGKRLINPNGTATLILPKNFTDGSGITANLITCESGVTRLILADMLGRTMKIFLESEIPTGEHLVQLDMKDIASGKYFIILQTPTKQITETLEVRR